MTCPYLIKTIVSRMPRIIAPTNVDGRSKNGIIAIKAKKPIAYILTVRS